MKTQILAAHQYINSILARDIGPKRPANIIYLSQYTTKE